MSTQLNGARETSVPKGQSSSYYLRQINAVREEINYNSAMLKNRVEFLLFCIEQLTQ